MPRDTRHSFTEYTIYLTILTVFPTIIMGLTLYRAVILVRHENKFRPNMDERTFIGLILYESERIIGGMFETV